MMVLAINHRREHISLIRIVHKRMGTAQEARTEAETSKVVTVKKHTMYNSHKAKELSIASLITSFIIKS